MIDWLFGDSDSAFYARVIIIVLLVVVPALMSAYIGKAILALCNRNVGLEGELVEQFNDGPLQQEVRPSNEGISRDPIGPEDPKDTAKAIERHRKEEWVKRYHRR